MAVLSDQKLITPLVSSKVNWGLPAWASEPDVEVLTVSHAVPSHDLSTATLRFRYGDIKRPGEATPGGVSKKDFDNNWFRVQYDYGTPGTPNIKNLFVGRFSEETREIFSKQGTDPAAGIQIFTVYGPYQQMRKRYVHRSVWAAGTAPAVKTINWVPPLNAYDDRNSIVGNRSNAKFGNSFVYSEEAELWNYRDYCEYLVDRFLNSSDANEPTWELTGDPFALEDLAKLTQPITWGETQSIADMFHQLIRRETGFDFYINYGGTVDAPTFQIYVFSLAATNVTFGSSTLRANPNVTQFDAANNPFLDIARFEKSVAQTYRRLRVIGNRIVVAASFIRVDSAGSPIEDGWTSTRETEYETGAGIPPITAQQNDDYRATDRFRDVYQLHHVKRDTSGLANYLFPSVDDNGDYSFTVRATNQDFIRETLSWTPLRQSFIYNATFPVDQSRGEIETSYLPPQAWIQRAGAGDSDPYINAERAGVGLSALPNDWGVQFYAFPNHIIADTFFTATNATEVGPEYSYKFMAMTIAWRADERFRMEQVLGPDPPAPTNADGVLDIYVPSAELWLICPDTIYNLEANGSFTKSNSNGMEARNDKDKLEQAMAGAIARYQTDRNRATISLWGIFDVDGGLGYILEGINDGTGDTAEIKAPITSVEWGFETSHKTEVRSGYAG